MNPQRQLLNPTALTTTMRPSPLCALLLAFAASCAAAQAPAALTEPGFQPANVSTQEACISRSFSTVAASCSNLGQQPIRSTLSAGPRDDMLALLQQCITPASSTKVGQPLCPSLRPPFEPGQ
ncbi:hypothetical protein V8C86DRAFT_360679 [Haematococcus lacustris]